MRLALGATPQRVLWMVIREGLVPVVGGMCAGAAAAVLLRQVLTASVFGLLSTLHVGFLVCVPVLVLGLSVVACYVPARRAAGVNPAAALRK
jgi:putative ABC transport system permease protein